MKKLICIGLVLFILTWAFSALYGGSQLAASPGNEGLSGNAILGLLQAIIILLLAWIKKDHSDSWKRINNHYHEVECENGACKKLRTGNVVIPRGGS